MAFPALFGYSEEHQIGSNTFWKLQTDCLNPDASFLETLGKVIVSVAGIPVGGYCTQGIILLGFIAALRQPSLRLLDYQGYWYFYESKNYRVQNTKWGV